MLSWHPQYAQTGVAFQLRLAQCCSEAVSAVPALPVELGTSSLISPDYMAVAPRGSGSNSSPLGASSLDPSSRLPVRPGF